jgi:hypothetical protein
VNVPVPPVALTVLLYGVPDVPFGSVVGLSVIAALIATVYARVPMAPMLSVARIVKLPDPALVGVPDITPVVGFSDSPAGKVPALTEKVLVPVPPVALMVRL